MKFIEMIIVLLILKQSEATAIAYQTRDVNREQIKLIESTMDLTADPCDDFYKYACGNWDRHVGSKFYFALDWLENNVNLQMTDAFNNFKIENKPKFIKEAYRFYKSCTSLKKYEVIKFLEWLEDNDNFKWSASWLHMKNNTQSNWVQRLAKMRMYNFNEVFLKQSFRYTKKSLIDLDIPDFKPLAKNNFVDLLESLPRKIPGKEIDKLWLEIKEFEDKLQGLSMLKDLESNDNKQYYFPIKDLSFDWLKDYLKIILNQTQLNDEMLIYIADIAYIGALDKLLSVYSQRFLCEYLETRFVLYLHIPSPIDFEDIYCLLRTRNLMPFAMYWQYEQLHPELQDDYDSINEIFTNVRKSFNSTVSKNKHGFNNTVVQYLQDKINNMKFRVNNLPRIDTVATLEKFYQSLNLTVDNFYENRLKLLNFHFLARRDLVNSSTPVIDKTYLRELREYYYSSPYYKGDYNIVVLPLTFLSYPMYSPGLDNVYKYSSVGVSLAHELFHGFDGDHISLDAYGRSTSFTQFEKNPSFNASFNCLLEINPKTLNERIADVSGVGHAYQAYLDSYADESNKTIPLHGNETSIRKIFFLNSAQFFCGLLDTEGIDFGEHGAYGDRFTVALSQFPEFSKEFNCNKSHRYYPTKTCDLWR